MGLSSDTLRSSEARRIALHAQGFADPRPAGRVDRRHFRRVLDRLSLVQIDSVNVLTRSHELPFLARLGPYPRAALARWLWGSGEVFEYWAHEASLLPVARHRLLRWRMAEDHQWGVTGEANLLERARAAIHDRGPVTLGQLEDVLGDAVRRAPAQPGSMWNWSPAKRAVEHLFWSGEVSATRNPTTFERHYAAPVQVVGAAPLAEPGPTADDAQKELLLLGARAHGVGTARDLADYYRVNIPTARRQLAELAADGAVREVRVEGWKHPAYLHPEAELPRRVRASALLSPFDSLIWQRDRTEDLFGFRYRIEIYTPAAKRVHGYYVVPFLHDGALVARFDLKADRPAGALLVRGSYREPTADLEAIMDPIVERLDELAGFLGLTDIRIEPNGDLAPALEARYA